MERSISISQLCNHSTNLHLCGYSEEVLDNLVRNGDLSGHFDYQSGQMMIDLDYVSGFLPSNSNGYFNWEDKRDEETYYEKLDGEL